MSEPRARAAGIGALALGAGALAVTTGVATAALGIANSASFHNLADAANELVSVVPAISFGIVGGLVASHQRRNPTGWLFLFGGVVAGLVGVADGYARLTDPTGRHGGPTGVHAEHNIRQFQASVDVPLAVIAGQERGARDIGLSNDK